MSIVQMCLKPPHSSGVLCPQTEHKQQIKALPKTLHTLSNGTGIQLWICQLRCVWFTVIYWIFYCYDGCEDDFKDRVWISNSA